MIQTRKLCIVFLITIASIGIATTGAVADSHSGDVEIELTDTTSAPGETLETEVHVTNNAGSDLEDTTVRFELEQNADDVTTTPASVDVGTVSAGSTVMESVTIDIPEEFRDDFQLKATADHTYATSPSSVSEVFEIETGDFAALEVTDVDSDVTVGESGTVTVDVENTGEAVAKNAQVQLESVGSTVTVSDSESLVSLGTVDVGETVEFEFESHVAASASSERKYGINAISTFGDSSGSTVSSPLDISVSPDDERTIDTEVVQTTSPVDGAGETTLEIENPNSQTIHDAHVDVTSTGSELTVTNGSRTIGDIDPDETVEVTVDTQFSDSASVSRAYDLAVTLQYETDNSVTNSITSDVSLSPTPKQDIGVSITDGVVPVGGSGEVALQLTNTNSIAMNAVDVSLSSKNSVVSFGGQPESSQRVGTLDAGAEHVIHDVLSVSDSARDSSTYTVTARIEYEDADGVSNTIEKTLEIHPEPEQDVTVSIEDTDFSEGTRDDVGFTVTNNGPKDVDDIEVTVQPRNDVTVTPLTFTVGHLSAGESETRNVTMEAPIDSETLIQELDITTQYEYEELAQPATVDQTLRFELDELESEFSVQTTERELPQGGENVLEITVTNNINESLSNINAEFSASSPLSVVDDSAYISELGPGESVTLNVRTSAGSSATPNSYPLDVDFQYDDANGDTRLSEVYSVQVDIVEGDTGSPISLIVVGLVVCLGIGIYYRKKIAQLIN